MKNFAKKMILYKKMLSYSLEKVRSIVGINKGSGTFSMYINDNIFIFFIAKPQ